MHSYLFRIVIRPVFLVFLLVLILSGCSQGGSSLPAGGPTPTRPPLQMRAYENPVTFDILYPAAWTYYIPSQGLIVFGDDRSSRIDQPGLSLTVQRISLIDVRGNLRESFQHYLDNGPLAAGYMVEEEIIETTLAGRPSFETLLTSDALDEWPAMVAYITAAETQTGTIYIFTGVAPAAEWEEVRDEFAVMVESVEFNE